MKNKSLPMNNSICVALDVDDRQKALDLADELADVVGGFKLGPRLCLRYGQKFIQEVAQRGPVFVDCKFFDIPSTMLASVQACYEAGASLVTVHAAAGVPALTELAHLERQLRSQNNSSVLQKKFRILAVTVLTSWEESQFPRCYKNQPLIRHVLDLAQDVVDSGLTGLVCSPHELQDLQFLIQSKDLYVVTPGIRLSSSETHDQKRVMTPQEALQAGSSLLVMGRPILQSPHPRKAATELALSLFEA